MDASVALLVGGQGTRLRAVVSDRPKPMAQVDGRPFLGFLLDWLWDAGFRRAVLCTGFMAESMEAALGSRWRDMDLVYSREARPLGTGGALRLALPHLDPLTLVLNGDSFFGFDLAAFLAWHRDAGARTSLALAAVPDTSRYGRVELGADSRITSFVEKGSTRDAGLINGGAYLIHRSRIQAIPEGIPVSLEREMFPRWIPEGLHGWTSQAPFLDIGTPASYASASGFFRGLPNP